MLPFLAKKKSAPSISISTTMKPDGRQEIQDNEEDQGLRSAAQDLINAIASKDASAVANAIKAAFSICDSEPQDEYDPSQDTE